MTVSLSDIADALRWFWVVVAVGWLAHAWLHRVPYGRVLWGVLGLVALDWGLHALADFIERPDSDIPSDFAVYSVIILLAAIVGLAVALVYARQRGMNLLTVIDAALVVVIVGGIGGRIYQALTNWDYYAENIADITNPTKGGFGIRGALVVGILALFIFALVTRNSFWKLGDVAAVGLALGQSIGWFGANLTYTHYGVTLDAAAPTGAFAPLALLARNFSYNFAQDLPDAYNLIALRVPVQLMASLFFLGLFVVLLVLAARGTTQPGALFLTYWILAAGASFLFGFLRGDETLLWNGLAVDQWVDLGMLLIGISLAVLHRGHLHRNVERRVLQHA